jgi:hypothetical protein
MEENKSIILVYASAFQEIGILFFVFGPMYLAFDTNLSGWAMLLGVVGWISVAFAFFRIGIEIQRRNS